MALIYETGFLGMSIRVFSDHVEYKPGLASGVDWIPINQIASVKVGSWLINRMVIETTGGRDFVITTGKKKQIAAAIYQATSDDSCHSVDVPDWPGECGG